MLALGLSPEAFGILPPYPLSFSSVRTNDVPFHDIVVLAILSGIGVLLISIA